MFKDTADIVGPVGSRFAIILGSATVIEAKLLVSGQPDVSLAIDRGAREIVVDSLPAGHSVLHLTLVWAPGDRDATIDLGGVIMGSVILASPRPTIPVGEIGAFVRLFGTDSTGPR